jgi:hypothetical protein
MNNKKIENDPLYKNDEVLQEVWRIKDQISAEHGHDIRRLFAHLREKYESCAVSSTASAPARPKRRAEATAPIKK